MPGYDKKIIISGRVIELYNYERPVLYNYKDKRKEKGGRSSMASEEDSKENRKKVCLRAERDLRRIINSNYNDGSSRFITLTFRENLQDFKIANYEFKKFILRFNYHIGYKAEYTVVIEFQERGAIHYHTVFYNLPRKLNLPKCRKIWGQGSFNCKLINDVDNVGAYITKYMTKNADDERLKGQKMYFNSRGLKKPIEIKEPELVEALVGSLQGQAPKYENTFENEHNSVNYKQYINEEE